MRYYVEQWHNGRWMHLNAFPTNEEAGAFYWKLFKAGMRNMRIFELCINGACL